LLMEAGIFSAIENILGIYANFAAGWIGALTADLVVNKPLGLSPPRIEFKRAHLYDVNPVGVGALGASIVASSLAYLGVFGEIAQILSPFVALGVAFVVAPLIAWRTGGKYYIAREPEALPEGQAEIRCSICENRFERSDMAMCPAYSGPICSLCCSLEARCHDVCKPHARMGSQLQRFLQRNLSKPVAAALNTRAGRFFGLLAVMNVAVGLLLLFIYSQSRGQLPLEREAVSTTLWLVFLSFLVLSGVVSWMVVLAHENRRSAEGETDRQTSMLMDEIEAHKRTDEALQKAKEAAESANVAKSRYIVGLSHEIRAPLNAIYGYAQLLERARGVPSDNAVRVIRRSAEHLTSLIDGLLDISRIEGGILRLNRDRVPLNEVLDQLEDMFRLQASTKGIAFRCERPRHLPAWVYADQKRLRQVLINLLSNAVKYTEAGEAALIVRYRNQVAEFEITDTGIGIPADELERVFEPFERGHAASVRSVPGTGLGLTITKLLVQIMGGEISVRSTVGVGTTFTAKLLLSEALHDVDAADQPRSINGYEGPRRRILLVDDDPAHTEVMTELLRALGFEVHSAGLGAAGLALAGDVRPDLAMVDISLPDTTGWEVVRALRAEPEFATLRVVMVSANAHEYSAGGSESLHDAFVVKPVDLHQLLETIRAQLRLTWRHEASIEAVGPVEQALPGLAQASRHHLEDLYQLGLIGHVRGIHAKLREVEAEDGSNLPLVGQLRNMVTRFEMKRYMATIEALRANG
ncbi:MAG: hybrid sensor histidine kinase/response regulator, partial [Steroidobacteraceae bacterium]